MAGGDGSDEIQSAFSVKVIIHIFFAEGELLALLNSLKKAA